MGLRSSFEWRAMAGQAGLTRPRRGEGTEERAAATRVRSAALTDSEVVKTFESSGSRRTMLALAFATSRYLPLTPPRSSDRSYSARRPAEDRLRAFCVAMCEEPLLLDGMVRIREGQRERIVEDGRGLGEADAVLPEVGGGLPRIPLVHRFSLAVASRRALESRRSSGRGGAPDGFHRRSRTTPAERSSA